MMVLDGYNSNLSGDDVMGTIVPQNSRWGLTNGYKIIEIYEDFADTARMEQGKDSQRCLPHDNHKQLGGEQFFGV